MEIRFTPTVADHVAALDFHERFSKWYRRAQRRHFVTTVVFALGASLLIALLCMRWLGWSWADTAIFVAIMTVLQCAVGRYAAVVFHARVRAQWYDALSTSPERVDSSEHRLSIEDENVVIATGSSQTRHAAKSLHRMIELPDALFMDFGPHVLRIPARAFASDDDRRQWYDAVSAAANKPISELLQT